MVRTSDDTKMAQSRMITRIGFFGLVLVAILLILIGLVVARSGLNTKRAKVMDALHRMHEQIDKTPEIMNRMIAIGDCGAGTQETVDTLESNVDSLDRDAGIDELNGVWDEIEDAWGEVNGNCGSISQNIYADISTEWEGVRNRFSVERGNYHDRAEIFNNALNTFSGRLAGFGMEEF